MRDLYVICFNSLPYSEYRINKPHPQNQAKPSLANAHKWSKKYRMK